MAKRRCKFGVNKRTKACLKRPRKKAGRRRKKAAKRRRGGYSAAGGSYCVTTTKPGAGKKALSFSTKCYRTKDSALSALRTRSAGAYSAMLHRPGPGARRRARR